MVVATMGTTGTLMGLYEGMKQFNPDIRWWEWSPSWAMPCRA